MHTTTLVKWWSVYNVYGPWGGLTFEYNAIYIPEIHGRHLSEVCILFMSIGYEHVLFYNSNVSNTCTQNIDSC